jgi:hypothetical protein
MGDQLAHESFVILERDHALVLVARSRPLEFDVLLDQPLDPEADGAGQDGEGRYGDLTTTLSSTSSIGPRKKSEGASRASLLIAEVEMIGRGIVEVYRALDEPEAEDTGVEVEIPLRIAGYAGDVMNTGSTKAHGTDSCLAFLGDLALIGAGTRRSTLAAVSALVLVRV